MRESKTHKKMEEVQFVERKREKLKRDTKERLVLEQNGYLSHLEYGDSGPKNVVEMFAIANALWIVI